MTGHAGPSVTHRSGTSPGRRRAWRPERQWPPTVSVHGGQRGHRAGLRSPGPVSLLLDTHVILWWLTDDAALSDEMKTRLDDEPDVYVSPASLWEVAIKQSIGKLSGPIDLAEEIGNSGFREVPIMFRHAIAAGRLPLVHRDPFDRMLVAQAQCEAMTLASRDPHIRRYDVALLPV